MAFFIWGVLALGLAGALVFSSQLEFLVPTLAAVVVLAVSVIPGLEQNWVVQTLLWIALSAGGLLLFRDRLQKVKWGPRKPVEDAVAGRIALVVEAIGEDGTGRVRFQGTTWKATSAEAAAAGTEVLILGQEGLVLQVEPAPRDRVEEAFRALESEAKEKAGEV